MNYLDYDVILELHENIIINFGGLSGIKDRGQIESILTHIQNDSYYPTIIDKLCHLFHSLVKFHCFNDGNKRTAIAFSELFLLNNDINILDFVIKTEDLAVGVAKGEIEKVDLKKFFNVLFLSFGYNI